MFIRPFFITFCMLLSQITYTMQYDQQLIDAAKIGDRATMQDRLVNHGADINAADQLNPSTVHTALIYAIENGHTQIVKFLIENNADIKGPNHCKYAALTTAINCHKLEIVTLLLQAGLDVNYSKMCSAPNTPLTFALAHSHTSGSLGDPKRFTSHVASKQCIDLAELLLDFKANPDLADQNYHTAPLTSAVMCRCSLLAECLLTYDATIPEVFANNPVLIKALKNQAELNQAVANKNFLAVRSLLQKGVYCNKAAKAFINQKLFDLIQADDVASLISLLKLGFGLYTCDKDGNTPLHTAIASRSDKVTSLLIYLLYKTQLIDKYLFKKNNAGFTPLDLALQNNHKMVALIAGMERPASTGWCTIS
ncbi:ankyrin repeat domain-containing protein [Candidatus Dependentiae bacterium]|nr:ankyrin repeat domain-containing protein [Candidatus Dependentiae bacterium]